MQAQCQCDYWASFLTKTGAQLEFKSYALTDAPMRRQLRYGVFRVDEQGRLKRLFLCMPIGGSAIVDRTIRWMRDPKDGEAERY